mgnify:FL=1
MPKSRASAQPPKRAPDRARLIPPGGGHRAPPAETLEAFLARGGQVERLGVTTGAKSMQLTWHELSERRLRPENQTPAPLKKR